MSKLSNLTERIQSLRDLAVEKERLNLARAVTAEATGTKLELDEIVQQVRFIEALIPPGSGLSDSTEEAQQMIAAQAKALRKLVQRTKFGTEEKISHHLETIRKRRQALETQKKNRWMTVQAEVKTLEIIAGIATTLRLDSVPVLEFAVRVFRNATNVPPSSQAEADAVTNARRQKDLAITNSGLTGNVKKILEGAINGDGEPRLLFEADVQQFFNDHSALWSSLRLKLV